jgi:hypothetical protein
MLLTELGNSAELTLVKARKNKEYAERNFYFQQYPGTSKGQCFEKME